jgi:glycosyltransferase involved in cell wall biosynthesis
MIHVALVSHLSEISGAGLSLLRRARALNAEKFRVQVILPGRGPLYELMCREGIPATVIENPEESWAAAPLRAKMALLRRRLAYILALMRHFRRAHVDVVYVNTTITVFAGIAAWLGRKPVVWHVHEAIENPSRATRLKMWLIEHLSDALFYDSATGMKLFPAPRVRRRLVVRNMVEVEAIRAAAPSPSLTAELGIRAGEIVITSNGVFPRKAPDVFLRAAAMVTQRVPELPLRFVLVGPALPGHAAYYNAMKELARDLGIADKVTFAGLRTDMPAVLALTDILVSPSRNEAQPIIVNEALVAGVPVVATDVGDCRAMLRDGEFGEVVPPDDPGALAEALVRVLADLEAARARARRAQAELIREFTSPDFWWPMEEVLEEVAGKK